MTTLLRARFTVAGLVLAGLRTAGLAPVDGPERTPPAALHARTNHISCPEPRPITYIPATADAATRARLRDTLKAALARANTIVLLGDGVDLDFTGLDSTFFPMDIAECVILTSRGAGGRGFRGGRGVVTGDRADANGRRDRRGVAASVTLSTALPAAVLPDGPEARTPSTPGPVLRFGPSRAGVTTFFSLRTFPDEDGRRGARADHVRISGFRIFGPKFGQQRTNEVGIRIIRSIDIDIGNMEIAGFAEQGVLIDDQDDGPDQPVGGNAPGSRIRNPDDIRIHDSYIHHNQHPNIDGHAGGYGVAAGLGAWMRVTHNVFDDNRHSIEASGKSGGYIAEYNLQLKGGGYHGEWYNKWTHPFDVHGTGSDGLGGAAGRDFLYVGNAFQYHKDNAIKIRGQPAVSVMIRDNVFPHDAVEKWPGDGAVYRKTTTNTHIGAGNQAKIDTFGEYGTCDFDGDGIDDLFLATGQTWWFSSYGEFPWSWMADRTERLRDVRLGYFDGDAKCDVLTQDATGAWVIASGGRGSWTSIGSFGVPLAEVVFGQFDPSVRDQRPGVTRRTTHAFRRAPNGQWFVTALAHVDWQPVQSSNKPLSELRFGDFTGDGVTDVLSVDGGRWSISESARGPWRRINTALGSAVRPLLLANMDADDNVDDLLDVQRSVVPISVGNAVRSYRVTLTERRSRNGTAAWTTWQQRQWTVPVSPEYVVPVWAFAARFGAAPGGGTMLIDPTRHGDFYSAAEVRVAANPTWKSTMAY